MLLAAVTLLRFFNPIRIKATGVYFELTLLTFSDSYLDIYQYVVHFTYFTVKKGGGASELSFRFSVLPHHGLFLCFYSDE